MSNTSVWSEVGPATLASLLHSRAVEQGEKTAFVFLADGEAEGERLTYAELDGRARSIASMLRESLAPGDRALLLYPPGLDFIAAFFGCLYAGVIAVPAYPPRFKDKLSGRSQGRLSAVIRDAEPRAALTTSTIFAAFSETPRVPELAAVRWIATDVLAGLEGSAAELPELDPESVAFLQYTSGSTSAPKGVMVTHANLLHNERMIGEAFRQDESSVVVGWLPLYHDMGLIGNVLQPLHAGGSCVLMAPVAFLQKPLRWLQAIDRFRGTTSGGPSFAYELCLRRIGEEERAGLDLSSWRLAYNGAEPVRAETLERFAEAFAPCGFRPEAFYPCYGLAEATLFVSGGQAGAIPRVAQVDAAALERNEARPAAGDAEERRLVSCGHAWAGQRIAVVDPESRVERPAGRVGEIWVAGPSVARGYWRNPEATARDFQARLAGEGDRINPGEGPFLRTGDLGFVRDGELYVTGRIKDLIIIRGRNHYPQDIELTAERSHPDLRSGCGAAFSAEVGGEERLVLVQEVERRRRDGFEEVAAAARRAVAEEHEVQVYEVVLVRMGTVPRTSSGKIQRRASRSLYLAGDLAVVGRSAVASDTPVMAVVERFLRERAAAAVGVAPESIDPETPLTGLGLDSLSAVELKAAVEAALGVPLPLADLLEGTGTGALAAALLPALAGEAMAQGPALRAGGVELGPQPLSFGQKALWFIERLAPEGGAYNVAVAARARGLDPAALRRALTALALRHPALRSVFPMVGDEPVRRVLDHPEIDFAVEDAAGWSEAWLAERLADEAYRPFDLGRGPLLRVRAFDRGEGEHALLLAVHHIAVDFASLAVVARDLAALLRQETELEPLPFGYSDFVRWQDEMLAGPRGERLWEHWRGALAGLPDLDLPADRPRPPVQTYRGGARALELPPELADGIRRLAEGQGTTLFMALLAVFQAQLARYSGQEDFAIGSPSAGRPPELSGAVGYFVNSVALRADLAADPTFAALLGTVRRTVLAGLENGDFPFALLAERLRPARDPARTPLFQVMFLLQRTRPEDAPGIATFALGEAGGHIDLGGVELESLRLEERRAQFDLTLRVAEEVGGRVRASLEFNADLFDAATAERMLGHFLRLLAGAVEHPAEPVSRLPLLTPAEREQALIQWNPASSEQQTEALLHGLFEEQAARTPQAEALVAGSERLTYEELNRRANQLARQLRLLGVAPETRVAVRLGRSADLVISLLGVLKAGGAYVPLDPQYPEERLALILADSGARVLLTPGRVERYRTDRTDPSDQSVLPGNLAYLIYTSGSTGQPKAVAIEHRSAALLVRWARGVFSPGELAGVLASTSVAFDLSVFEIFVPLAWGGRVILAENALELPRLPASGDVSLVNTVPSALAELLRSGGLPPSVRTVNLAGEPIPPSLAEAVHGLSDCGYEGVRLYNLYGPSEDTTYSTWTLIAPGADVTIGRPIDGTRAYVVDARGELLPVGVPGELHLGGGGLARGYLDRPELTAERFVPDPFGDQTDRSDRTDRSDWGGRLYRTGDLVQRRADGDLEFLGRIDHQVKIRGFRVEPGEVEAVLLTHPAVRTAAVAAIPEAGGGSRLAAWVASTTEEAPAPAALRTFLGERLPAWMVPASYTILRALPLTPHGKIDRRALPQPRIEPAGEDQAAPRSPVEEMLAGLWKELLGVERVGLRDGFFDLGGHSLTATQLVSRVRKAFGVDLPVAVVFEAPVLGDLAARLEEAIRGSAQEPQPPLVRRPEGEAAPLSYAQQRLWFLDQLEPGSAAYNVPGALRLNGPLRVEALERSLAEIVRRHEVLRTVFQASGGVPVQIVLPPGGPGLPVVDLEGLPAAVRETEALARIGEEAARPFDLERGGPLQVVLLRLSAEDHLLSVGMHHIASDAWSLRILLRELSALYAAFLEGRPSPLPELPVQYADFALWQRRWLAGDALERQLASWRRILAGAPSSLALPTDRPRPAVPTYSGGRRPFHLGPAETGPLQDLARRDGWTFFMLLLAAFQALLSRSSGQEDVVVGSPIANRTRLETEGLIGFFTNTLALRLDLSGDPSFRELGRRARAAALESYTHQDLPFEKLVEDLAPERHPGRNPLFQALLVVQHEPEPPRLPGLRARLLDVDPGVAKLDLTVMLIEEAGGVTGFLEHSRDLFDAATADRMLGHFRTLLAGVAADPGLRLSELPLLTAAERDELLAWGRAPGPRARPELVHERVAAQAERTPEATAVELGSERLAYGELVARARGLAYRLAGLCVGPDVPVGIFLERSLHQMVAVLAVLEAGGAYFPLDPRYPAERLRLMIEDAGAPVVLTQRSLAGALPPGAGRSLLVDGTEALAAAAGVKLPPLLSGVTPEHLVSLIYTSGSTGRPKGVAMTHQAISAMLHWQVRTSAVPAGRTLQYTTLSFDVSFQEIFSTWWAGGALVLVSEDVRRDPAALLAWLDAQRVERLFLPFVALQQLAVAAADAAAPGSLREILSAGEQLFVTPQVASLLARCPGAVLQNHYGPTETHVVTWLALDGDPAGWPQCPAIGRPLDHAHVLLLDQGLRPVPIGVTGEVFAGGTGLARGYLGRPGLTAERFVPNPFAGDPGSRMYRTGDLAWLRPDGLLEYLGRGDSQVKVRGHRIELHEVEMALARHPAVALAAVAVRGVEAGEKRLAACVVLRDGGPAPSLSELRRFLAETLPDPMIPSVWARVQSLPRTPSGKLDRQALERLEPEEDRDAGEARVPPRTPTEELLAELWRQVLGIERVGVHDDFFELGGHSLLATQVVSRLRETFHVDLPLRRLFEATTLAALAAAVDAAARDGAVAPPIRPVPRGEAGLPLSFAQERLWFLDRLQPGTAYSVPLALRLRGHLDTGRLGRAFGSIVARQEALRTVFVERDGEPAQLTLPAAPPEAWPLPVVDVAGLDGARAEAAAAALACEDALLPFDLATGPLLRTTLLRRSDRDRVLLLDMHHIVSDGWSLGVLLRELAAFYGGTPESLPELPVQYADFAVWQRSWLRGEELERQTAYWREQLAGAPAVLDLPTDRPRPLLATTNGARQPVALAPGLTARLAGIARRQVATPFMLLLAAWVMLLHRFSRQGDLNVGTPIAGRNHSEIEHLVGFFVNTLVMRADLADDPAFPDLLARLRQTALAAYDHQDLPFEKLVDELRPERDTSRQPLFQVMFALQNAPLGVLELPGLTLEPADLGATVAKFDLTLSLIELGGTLTGALEYNTDLFDATTAARLAAQWSVLLEGIAAQPGLRIGELPLLTAGERHQLLVEWAAAWPEPRGRLLHALIERHSDLRPDAPAVEHGKIRWSYGELESRANRLAWFLRELGVGPEARVALVVERTADAIMAMLGVLKAGGVYVPLDPAYPLERLAFMLGDCGARVVLTQERLLGRLPNRPEAMARVVCLDGDWGEIARRPEERPASGVTGSSPAYAIYTSGSTGTPKGVVVPHEAAAAYSQACGVSCGTGPGERELQFSSISFDTSVGEIYSALTRGATLVVRGEVQEGVVELIERCRAGRITVLQLPTAFWHQLAAAMETEELQLPETLRVLYVGGEKMLAQRLISWWPLVPPGVLLVNAYGPTEITVAAVLCPIPDAVAVDGKLREVPIGRPVPYARAYVLDRGLRPVPIGVAGELCLGGLGVSRGYLGRPELTAERFIPNPHAGLWGEPGERVYRTGDLVRLLPDGLLEFIGRTDHQVKIRGYRIEPGEIEASLAAHPAVGEVVVLTREEASGDVRLIAWTAARGEPAPTSAELRAWLEERLPSYMVPAAIQVLPSLPVNAQGKVDRRALERLAPQTRERAAFAVPRNEFEAAIAAVWREVFGLDPADAVGVHDNFFEAGGSSLLLVKLHSRLQKALGRNFPLVEMFKHPTIAALAASLGVGDPARPSQDKARARTETRRESMQQLQQLRDQRRRRG